jgi:hypothetical protein
MDRRHRWSYSQEDSPPPFSMSSSPCPRQQVSKHTTQCVPLQENTSEVAPQSFASAVAEKVDREELRSQAFHQVAAPLLVASIKGCVMGTYELIQTIFTLSSLGSTREKEGGRCSYCLFR